MVPTSDPTGGTAPTDSQLGGGSALAHAPATTFAGPRSSPLTSGHRWHAYEIGELEPGGPGWCYRAINIATLDNALIRVFPIDAQDDLRKQIWEARKKLDPLRVLGGITVHEHDGFRFEISQGAMETTLREWAACRKASFKDIEGLIRQISSTLGVLHENGLVHLNLRPTTVFVPDEDKETHVVLGGFEHTTLFEQNEPLPIAVDPYYAPPEAAGMDQHAPGQALRAWDWWCLGRVIQEIVLGHHILSDLEGRDVSRTRAEALLLETEPNAPKAGAVECMEDVDKDLIRLLRGLLASSRDGRWGYDEVRRWLNHENVPDRYNLTRYDRLFQWRDRTFTVAEAAEYFSREENWDDGVLNLFAPEDPRTLVHFLGAVSSYHLTRVQVDELRAYAELPAWNTLPQETVRSVIASVIWLSLRQDKGQLMLHGRKVDLVFLRSLLNAEVSAQGLALMRALTVWPYIRLVERNDPETSELLGAVANRVSETAARAEQYGWMTIADETAHERLLALVLEPEATLRTVSQRLHELYAISRNGAVSALFTTEKPSYTELVLLAFAERDPERFEFVTHLNWNREQYTAYRSQGARIAAAIFWRRLERILHLGWLVFGSWRRVIVLWSLVGTGLWKLGPAFFHGPWAVLPLAVLVGIRLAGVNSQRKDAERHAPGSPPWTSRCRVEQCGKALVVVAADQATVALSNLHRELARINLEIGRLELGVQPALVPAPHLLSSWGAVAAGWMMCVSLLVWTGSYRLRESGAGDLSTAVKRFLFPVADGSLDGSPPVKEETPSPEELFFRDTHAKPKPWNFQQPVEAPSLPVEHLLPATPDQIASALVIAQRLLQPFASKSVSATIAVNVPLSGNSGVMIYDGRMRRLTAKKVFVVHDLPSEPTWFSVGDRMVLYLTSPQ